MLAAALIVLTAHSLFHHRHQFRNPRVCVAVTAAAAWAVAEAFAGAAVLVRFLVGGGADCTARNYLGPCS